MFSSPSLREKYHTRQKFYGSIRDFFKKKGFLEVETPLLSPTLIPETAIEIFRSDFVHPWEETLPFYLIPSPEIFMKELISLGMGSIYQITKSFRNAESTSPRHNPEFSMLEWYSIGENYKDNIDFTQEFFKSLLPLATPSAQEYLLREPCLMSMREAFLNLLDLDLDQCVTFEELKAQALEKGYRDFVERSATWEELFNFLFVTYVEPALPSFSQPVYLMDYPHQVVTTAKKKEREPYYERWELYMKGLEIANCFSEETLALKVQEMLLGEAPLKKKSLVPHAVDFEYSKLFEEDKFPSCSGVAMGLDRVLMVLREAASIEEVLAFPFSTLKKKAIRVKKEGI